MLRSKGSSSFLCLSDTADLDQGKQLVFVTNNSTKSRADYKKKFDKLGIPAEVVC
jgi:ribonucleotide monophosphatase NagD (HAD superfamily)